LIVAQIVVRFGMPPGMPDWLQSILRSWGIISADAVSIAATLESNADKMIILNSQVIFNLEFISSPRIPVRNRVFHPPFL
jgi:hypothetical protein